MNHLKIISLYFSNSLQQQLANPSGLVIFFIAKLLRYGLFLAFLYLLVSQVSQVVGFTRDQIVLFYLVFNLIDTGSQLVFREVYRFRPLIISGGFDMVLTKPFSALLRVLIGGPDFIDLGILVVILAAMIYVAAGQHPSLSNVLVAILLIVNSFVISTAFHIFVLGIGIMTFSVDHLVMIYRDLTSLARIPVDMFISPFRFIFSFIIPLGIMFTFPAKAILGLLSWHFVLISLGIGVISLWASLQFWHFAVKKYSSAGS